MYITAQDIRDEGISGEDYHDNWINHRIALAQSLIEKLTGRFFETRAALTLLLNGRGHPILWLPVAPISISAITEVKISDEVLDSEFYTVLMGTFPDGRFNPKLYRPGGTWPKGIQNISITGSFGFVESDESAPPEIKELCKRIVMWNLPLIGDAEAQKSSNIIEEGLEDYSYKLTEASSLGYFGDVKIDSLIAMFKVKRITSV